MLPVKVSLRIAGSSKNTDDTATGSCVVTTWNTSAGPPASRHSSSRRMAVSGDCSAGFTTKVQPAASAGAALRVTIAAGKFHGVTAETGPTGCGRTMRRLCANWLGTVSP